MKILYQFLIIAFVFLLQSNGITAQKKFKVTGTVDNLKEGTIFTVFSGPGFESVKPDTIQIKNHKFQYKGTIAEPRFVFLYFADLNDRLPSYGIPLFLEGSNIKIKADVKNLKKATVTGSKLHEQHRQILHNTPLFDSLEVVNGRLNMAIKNGEQPAIDSLEIVRAGILDNVTSYLTSLPDYKTNLAVVFVIYEHLGMIMDDQKLETLLKSFSPDAQRSMYAQFLLDNIEKKKMLAIGKKAPDFSLKNKNGKEYTLQDYRGKLLLLDFGASWCYWCKLETPYLREAYDRYKENGLEVLNISLDHDKEAWLKDLKKENYPWESVSDLKAWEGDVVKDYNIGGVPVIFLIGPDGTILQNDIRGAKIGMAIRDYLGIKEDENDFSIKGKMDYSTDGQKIYLQYKSVDGMVLDSTTSFNGHFFFRGKVAGPELATLLLDSAGTGFGEFDKSADKLFFYIDRENIQIESKGTLKDAAVLGSPINKLHKEYKEFVAAPIDKMKALNERYVNADEKTRQSKSFIREMDEKFSAAEDQLIQLQKEYISSHPASVFSLSALFELMNVYDDPREIEPLFSGLDEIIRTSERGQSMATHLTKLKATSIGANAIDIVQPDKNGKEISLKDFRGKYVLIDFWASWCGPCRQENPNLVAAYKKYKNKNFTVLGVSLDTENNREKWLKAIIDDGLTWTQVSDLKGWANEAAKSYGVRGIPQNFLIDPNGKIVAKNLRAEELHRTLEEILHK